MTGLKYPTTTNAAQKTLDAALNAGVTASATFNNTTGIQNKAGVFVVDRVDTAGALTPSKREYIGFTGTSGSTVVTLTRNIDGGGSDQDHAVGAIVEFGPDAVWADGVMDALDNLVDSTGAVDTTKVVTLTGTQTLTNKTLTAPAMTSPDITSGDIKIATGANIQVNSADPLRTIVLPAGSMSPTTTAGCASVTTVEAGTNDVDYKVLDFDKDTDESAFAIFSMPDSWDGGTITVAPYWTTAGTTGTVVFSVAGRAFANDDAIDQAYGTPQTSTDTFIAAADVHIGPASSAITLAGSPAGGQLVQLKITRDVSEDTLDADARLIALKIEYSVAQYSD